MANQNQIIIRSIQLKHGTASNLAKSEEVLKTGEIVVNTTYRTFRVGDGISKIKDLAEPDYTTTEGDHILSMKLATLSQVVAAKSGHYWQIVDDGKDPDTQLPGVLGYQWIRKADNPDLFTQVYQGYILLSSKYGATVTTNPEVYDDTTACDKCGGVEWDVENVGTSTSPTYQLECSDEFNQYYGNHLNINASGGAESSSVAVQKSYKGMIILTTYTGLNSLENVKTAFGGNTWEVCPTITESGVQRRMTPAECKAMYGMYQYVCTDNDVNPTSSPTQILNSFVGMRVNMYLPEISSSSDAEAYAQKLYGGTTWEKVEADQDTTHIWQLVRTA